MSAKKGMPAVHDMHPNVTPLIDIVMCLIIFYMLVARIGVNTGADNSLKLPVSLLGIQLKDMGNTVVLNILRPPGVDDDPIITTMNPLTGQVIPVPILDRTRTPPVRTLTEWLKHLRGQNEEFKVAIHADRDLPYKWIEPVLICCAEARAKNVNFATNKPTAVVASH